MSGNDDPRHGTSTAPDSGERPASDVDARPRPRLESGENLADLQARERAFRTLAENSPDVIVRYDTECRRVYVNPAYERVNGIAATEVLGTRPVERATTLAPMAGEFTARLKETMATGVATNIDLQWTVGGRHFVWYVRAIPEYDAHGEVVSVLTIWTDITERVRAEEARTRSEKLEALGTLAGGIAHDFNNLLAAIQSNADLVAADLGPDHPAMEGVTAIQKASARGAALVRRIVTFGRPEEPHRERVDLGAVLDEVVKLLRPTLPAGIVLRTHVGLDPSPVQADASQVHEAIVNLTTNAAYAIGAHAGSIDYTVGTVNVGPTQAPGLELSAGRYTVLTVADTGSGMDPTTIARAFDAFYTTKPTGDGSGLGLSMVYGIMRSHGGSVAVESAPGAGARFHLYFPAATGPDAHEPPATIDDEEGLPLRTLRVLYVDDEPAIASVARRALTRVGHLVTELTDPQAALETFRADPDRFDVVVTDLAMPGMSGFDLARRLRALRPDVPVILTTGYAGVEEEERVRQDGIDALLLKPPSMNELVRALDRAARRK